MKYRHLLPLLFLLPPAMANEAAMKQAFSVWEQEMAEFRAAAEFARTPEQKARLQAPDGKNVAARLWKAISAKTGERTVANPHADLKDPKSPKTRNIPTYEFEQEWAAPAVVWFINHPDAFAEMLQDKPRQRAYFAEALLDSINRIHYRAPIIADACAMLAQSTTSQVYDILEKIYTRNETDAAKANAALGMCIMLGNPLLSGSMGSANVRAKRVYYLRQALVLAPENAMFGTQPIQDVAGELTYTLRHLSVGTVPPQISVRGMDGKTTQLPQPGKPHLLYFWSPQDAANIEAVRHMEGVKERFPNLVICPITPHQDDTAWHTTMEQNGISTCYEDDEQGSAGTAYRLSQLPVAVLVNESCRILYIGAPGLQLQTAIDSLTAEKSPQKPSGRIIIGGEDDKPVIQPPVRPNAPTDTEAPALRDMPEF